MARCADARQRTGYPLYPGSRRGGVHRERRAAKALPRIEPHCPQHNGIAAELNRLGIPTPSGGGGNGTAPVSVICGGGLGEL